MERIFACAKASPTVLTSYPTELVLLAREQRAGRLDLDLTGIWSGGESLTGRDRAEIGAAFGCPVVDDYGASEFLNIAYDCGCGSLHLNRDWVILEPVDRDYRPVAPGEPSWTVLLTNLANHVQPIIRYDLGDSVTFAKRPCRCGSPLPALRVGGRRDDTVALAAAEHRDEQQGAGATRVLPEGELVRGPAAEAVRAHGGRPRAVVSRCASMPRRASGAAPASAPRKPGAGIAPSWEPTRSWSKRTRPRRR